MLTGLFLLVAGVMAVPLYAFINRDPARGIWVGAVYYDRAILSFFGMVLVAAVAILAFQLDQFTYLLTNPWNVLAVVAGYAVAGLIWGYGNWYVFMFKIKNALYGAADDWKATGGITKRTFEEFASSKLREDNVICYGEHWPIRVREHIRSISMWMAYWPASLIWTVFGDLLQTLYTRVVVWMSTLFQKIASNHDAAIMAEATKVTKDNPGNL